MAELPIGLKVQHYRCFGEEFVGFDTIKPINVLIGRNNSGKSALLDVVQAACESRPTFRAQDSAPGKAAVLEFAKAISEQEARRVFPEGTSGGDIRTANHWIAGQRYVGAQIVWRQPSGGDRESRSIAAISVELQDLYRTPAGKVNSENALARSMVNPLQGKVFRRLSAERNIRPELDSPDSTEPLPDGSNVTNLIQRFYNSADLDRSVVEELLLGQLNEIVAPDYEFHEIVLRRLTNQQWEIFLREAEKGLVPLSASGSGLKTILCVLAFMVLRPIYSKQHALESYVFGFEELENSLHPALLRRLLLYIARRVKKEDSIVFLTTHSSTAIDLFANDDDAQIVHTTHRPGGETKARTVSEYLHKRDILHDLDVRASDLLQANSIVWVEGPSDRTYMNHWIALFTNRGLREGTHYQCVFYGGKLLARLSGDDPEEPEGDLLSILRVNHNAVVVIDSDRNGPDGPINATKQRMRDEVLGMQGMAWITAGREIENYLPRTAIAEASGVAEVAALAQFADLGGHLEQASEGAGRRFERAKAEFAAIAIDQLTYDNQSVILDWSERMIELTTHIWRWNRLPPPQ